MIVFINNGQRRGSGKIAPRASQKTRGGAGKKGKILKVNKKKRTGHPEGLSHQSGAGIETHDEKSR